jgi:FAD/FMN-containing dehydrogenase
METMLRVRAAFDPSGLCNPGKIIPTSRSCGEARAASARSEKRETPATGNNGKMPRASAEARQEDGAPASSGRAALKKNESEAGREPKAATQASTVSRNAAGALGSGIMPAGQQQQQALLAGIVGAEHVFAYQSDQRLRVAPATYEEAREVLRLASREGWGVEPAGAASWHESSMPARAGTIVLGTRRLDRIKEHEPADLIATAEAGVTLAALNSELSAKGQRLPLDPPGSPGTTLGGVVARGLGGAQQPGYGPPRSHVIGMRVALADGRLVRAGGRVVKNVAGYDLCKLFTGSFGTLGLILELTFKLRPLPEREASVVAFGPLAALLGASRKLLSSSLLPLAVEVLSPLAAARLVPGGRAMDCALLVRFGGSSSAVGYQLESALGRCRDERIPAAEVLEDDEGLWRELSALAFQEERELAWRAHVPPTELPSLLDALVQQESAAFPSLLWQAGAADGRLRALSLTGEPGATLAALKDLRAGVEAKGGALIIEKAPGELKLSLDPWGLRRGPNAKLMKRIRLQLDPEETFSPGRYFRSD